MVCEKIVVRGRNPNSKERRRKLPNSILKCLNAIEGRSLYFYHKDNTTVVTISRSPKEKPLFSIAVDYNHRSRLSETNLKKMGAAFEDSLEFEFSGEGKALVKVLSQHKRNKEYIVPSLPKLIIGRDRKSTQAIERPKSKIKQTLSESEAEQKSIEESIKGGVGFGNPEMNRKVERAAVQIVTLWYKTQGWEVISVELEKIGYDLRCVKGTMEEHVEVKGRRGGLPSFIITSREKQQAINDPWFVICVVTLALGENPKQYRYTGKEFIESFDLSPIAYRAVKK